MLVRAGEQNATLDFGPEPRRSAGSRGRVGVLGQQQVVAHHTAFGHDEHHGQNLAGQRDQVGQGDAGYLAQAISGRGIVASIADVGVFHARRCTDEMLTTKNNNHKSKLFIQSAIHVLYSLEDTVKPLNMDFQKKCVITITTFRAFFLAIRAAAVLLFCSSSSAICQFLIISHLDLVETSHLCLSHFRLVEFHSDILLLVFIYRIDEPGTYFYKQERFGIG
ncbi:hypothetical protein T08_1970 [Trichinella sp. T8]|nr:hypothetical protein T08_1970 [Trichinella sp. T8]